MEDGTSAPQPFSDPLSSTYLYSNSMGIQYAGKRWRSIRLGLALTLVLAGCQLAGRRGSDNPDGEAVYLQHCVACHGRDGGKVSGSGGQALKGRRAPIARIKETVRNGIPPVMPAYPRIDDSSLEKLAEYVNRL